MGNVAHKILNIDIDNYLILSHYYIVHSIQVINSIFQQKFGQMVFMMAKPVIIIGILIDLK